MILVKIDFNQTTERCRGCGKKGHQAKDCPATNKKKEKINMLILEEVKDKLYSILEYNNSSYHNNLSNDDQVEMAYSSEDSKSTDTWNVVV